MNLLFRRRRFIIKPSFQIRSALSAMLFLLVLTIAIGFSIFYPLQRQLQSAKHLEEQLPISNEILVLHKRLWPGVFIAEALMGIFIIFTTHRIAGPLYRMEKTILELIKGNYKIRIHLRKGDECQELSDQLNLLAETLEASRSQTEKLIRTCVTRLQDLNQTIGRDAGAKAQVEPAILSIINKLESLVTDPEASVSKEPRC